MKKQGKTVVSRKPNKIIEARQGLSVVQHKILFAVLSKFRWKIANTEIKTAQDYVDLIQTRYEINLSDIIPDLKKMKAEEGSALFNHVEKECKKITSQTHEIQNDNGWERFIIIDYAEFFRKEMKIIVGIAHSMIELILKWYKTGYTQVPMKDVIPLRSKYSIRIFELLLRVMNIPEIKEDGYTISYEELRRKLGIQEKEYTRFFHFNDRILRQAQKEICEKTSMKFGYRKEKNFFTKKLNVVFFDIVYKMDVKEVLPAQLEFFDFERMEENNDQKIAENSKKILDFVDDLDRQREEREKKIDEYLEGVFDADEIKFNHSFEYIEYYYKKAVNADELGIVKKNFAGFFYKLLDKDKDKFYEQAAKKEKENEAVLAKEKAKREQIEKQKLEEKNKREQDELKQKKYVSIFDSLDDEKRKAYLEKLYTQNDLYKNMDKAGISDPTKYAIGKMIEEEQVTGNNR